MANGSNKTRNINEVNWNDIGGTYRATMEGVRGYVTINLMDIDETIAFPVTVGDINGWIKTLKRLKNGMQHELAKCMAGIDE